MRSNLHLAAVVLVAVALLAGCTDPVAALPPVDVTGLADIYAEDLTAFDMALTDRGGLVDLEGGYASSRDGTHLALYTAPTRPLDDAAHARGVVGITALFATDVFERWPGLTSFDVCQEVHTGTFGSDAQPTRSQVTLTREVAASIDWDTVTLEELMAAARRDETSRVLLDRDLQLHLDITASDDGD